MIAVNANYSYYWYDLSLGIGLVNINVQPTNNLPTGETTVFRLPNAIKDIANVTSAAPINIAGCHAIIRAGGEVKVYLGTAARPRIYGQIMFTLTNDQS